MKHTTIKQMKDTGWYEFVQWAIRDGIKPETLTPDHWRFGGRTCVSWDCVEK